MANTGRDVSVGSYWKFIHPTRPTTLLRIEKIYNSHSGMLCVIVEDQDHKVNRISVSNLLEHYERVKYAP